MFETTPTIIWGVYDSRVKTMFYIITFWGYIPSLTLFSKFNFLSHNYIKCFLHLSFFLFFKKKKIPVIIKTFFQAYTIVPDLNSYVIFIFQKFYEKPMYELNEHEIIIILLLINLLICYTSTSSVAIYTNEEVVCHYFITGVKNTFIIIVWWK